MEVDNILDALVLDGVSEIIQYCKCEYNGKSLEFRLINDECGVIDEIEYKISDNEYALDYDDNSDEDINFIVNAVYNAPMEVFHKSDIGAELMLNHQSIKEQNVPDHLKTDFYVDPEGPIKIFLIKNLIKLD